jgi:hypothetical protein
MEAEDQKFCEIMDNIAQAVYHMDDDEARPIINKFLIEYPELLEIHNKEWYYKYC